MKFTINDLKRLGPNYKDVAIRQLRKPLLEAFDVYKSNIAYGIESESESDKYEILMWYQDLLDKKESALENIPKKIQRYL